VGAASSRDYLTTPLLCHFERMREIHHNIVMLNYGSEQQFRASEELVSNG
jgi:hypothetical protein